LRDVSVRIVSQLTDLPALSCTISVSSNPAADWDVFVRAQPNASVYFLSGWSLSIRELFKHDVYFIEARDSVGVLLGLLPVVRQKSLLGHFATSLAFFNYGGPLANSNEVAVALMDRARQLAQSLSCSYLELRDRVQRDVDWPLRTDKVSMVLTLPQTFAELSKALGSKLRSQVKRADREEPSVRVGGAELVADFYGVFTHTMRDLGTPVYPRRFFDALVFAFPEYCKLVVTYSRGKAVAAGFLVIYNGFAEIPWAACLADAKPMGFNMKLYWEVLQYVVDSGCQSFDFGRSTVDAGTYKFKKQWGAQPVQLYWYRWDKHRATEESAHPAGRGRATALLSRVWQKLPVSIANKLGPLVSPSLPW
jgi:FemAB-related protein (PEP-CTERM system-associated)